MDNIFKELKNLTEEMEMITANTTNTNKNTNKTYMVVEPARQAYEQSVSMRMNGRNGAQTKTGSSGIAFEIMATDKQNLKDVFNPNVHTKLTKNPVATQVDAVRMDGGKVIQRIQYKDTPSTSGIKKTVDQVKAQKYNQATLVGTTETAQSFNSRGLNKKMVDSRISTNATNRIANKHLGKPVTMSQIGDAVKTSIGPTVALTAGAEVLKSVINDDSFEDCVNHVTSKSAESVVNGTVAIATGELVLGALATGPLATVAVPAAFVAGLAGGAITSEFTNGLFDEVGEVLGDIAGDVKDIGSDILYDAVDIGTELVETAFDTVETIASDIGDFFSDLFFGW